MHYLINNFDVVRMRFGEHLRLTLVALIIALIIALPLGVLLNRIKWLETPVMSVLNMLYTIPSLALLVLLVPFLGLGADTATVVLVVYAQVILVRNIVVGLNGVNPDIVEAARGMGMNGWQRFFRIELPLALPVMIAGVRIATVTIIGIATVAALINAGGLGRILFEGVSRRSESRIIAGSIAAAFLAALANGLLRLLEWRATLATRGDEA
jgi:osmoprotectant transport system permease protein